MVWPTMRGRMFIVGHACGKKIEEVISKLEENFCILSKWFKLNCLQLNEDKSHLLASNHTSDININVGANTITCSGSIKLLGLRIDNTLKFDEHVSSLCKMANQKLHALASISNYIPSAKLKMLMKSFVISQFSYCPLIWIFHSKKMNNRINHLHERALKLAYNDSTFESLLERDNSLTIHERNLQLLATEMYKLRNGLAPKIMEDLFTPREIKYNIRGCNVFKSPNVNTVYYGKETLSLVTVEIQNCPSLKIFKEKIKM